MRARVTELTTMIEQVKKAIEQIAAEEKIVDSMVEKAKSLRDRGLLPDHTYNMVASLAGKLRELENIIEKSKNIIR